MKKNKSKYAAYSEPTQIRMEEIESAIVERYGEVPPRHNTALFLLADNLDLLADVRATLREEGLFVDGKRNPLLNSCVQLSAAVQASVKTLCVSPYADGLFKAKTNEESAEDFVNHLTR